MKSFSPPTLLSAPSTLKSADNADYGPLAAEQSPIYDLIFMHHSPLAAEPSSVYGLIFVCDSLLTAELGTTKTRIG